MDGTTSPDGAGNTAKKSAKKRRKIRTRGGPGNPSKIVEHQFKKDDPLTGFKDPRINREGRPPEPPNLRRDINEQLGEMVLCSDGERRTYSKAIARVACNAAAAGSHRHLTVLIASQDPGKMPVVTEVVPGTQVNVNVNAQANAEATVGEKRIGLANRLRQIYGLAPVG
jgi:hypothetical protein